MYGHRFVAWLLTQTKEMYVLAVHTFVVSGRLEGAPSGPSVHRA